MKKTANNATAGAAPKTVSQTAKELQDDFRKNGYFSASKMQLIFGDPRQGVEVKNTTEKCFAYTRQK